MNLNNWPSDFHTGLLELAKGGNLNDQEVKEKWDELMDFKRKHLPRCLLRFRPIQNENDLKFRKSEIDGVLYFSDVRKQNDPVDSALLLMNQDDSFLNGLVKSRIDDAVNSGYIVCFNESPINSLRTLPMWAHYAKDHKGCCMKYDNISLWPTEWQDALFPVKYIPEDKFLDYLKDFKISNNVWIHGCGLLSKYIMTNKLDTWSYEHEWRIILDKNLLNKFSKIPDKDIRIHPTRDMPNEQGIPLFKYKNRYQEQTWNEIKEHLVKVEKILGRTDGDVYDEPIFKIQEKPIDEKIFETFLRDNGKRDLGIINHKLNNNELNNNEPQFRGISMKCLKPSEIILGKDIDGNFKKTLIEYCEKKIDISQITISDEHIISNQELKKVDKTIAEVSDSFVLKQFLLEHKAEVKGMILTEYNEEEVMNGFKEEAYMDGVIKTLIDLVREQLLSISDAAKKLNVSEIEFKRLMEKV